MKRSQQFLWLVLVTVTVTSLIIVLIFIIINVCISRQAVKRRLQISRPDQTNSSHEENNLFTAQTDVEKPPPLPSREQFLESRSHSYEDMPNFEIPLKEAVQTSAPAQSAFFQQSEPQNNPEDTKSVKSESYDDVDELDLIAGQSCEDAVSIPDYLDLEEDPPVLLQQTECSNDQNISRESLASSYYDVEAIDNVSEDYDDVG